MKFQVVSAGLIGDSDPGYYRVIVEDETTLSFSCHVKNVIELKEVLTNRMRAQSDVKALEALVGQSIDI